MKRDIKFRGKRLDNGEWILGYLFQDDDDHFPEIHACGTLDNWEQVREATVGQYTGRTDKNGIEIYEDDIILQQGNSGRRVPMLVRFEDGAFVVGRHKGASTPDRPMPIQKRCEVIGNIHDNPEILKGGEQ
ncbi:MAG: YopX family protein [Bacteroidales bacterium]|nr:YopX family protein [Bacteroidales bacterium]